MSGLVGWWPLNETEGDTAYDLSGNGNHGSTNGANIGVSGWLGLSSYKFDGSGDRVELDNTKDKFQHLIEEGQDGSVSVWIKPRLKFTDDSSDRMMILSHHGSISRSNTSFSLWLVPRGEDGMSVNLKVSDGGDSYVYDSDTASSGFYLAEDRWYHIVVNMDGSQSPNHGGRIYVDGDFRNRREGEEFNEVSSFDNNLHIGYSPERDRDFEGKIQDVRIYNRMLTSSEIQKLYRQGSRDLHKKSLSDGSDSGAVSRWKLSDGGADGSTAVDSWGGNDGSIEGASFTDDSVRSDGRALQCGGESDYVDAGNIDLSKSDNLTLAAWTRSSDTSQSEPILGARGNDGEIMNLWHTSQPSFHFRIGVANSNEHELHYQVSSDFISEWNHMVGVYRGDANETRLYINGVLRDKKDGEIDEFSTNENFQIGSRGGRDDYFAGKIDNVCIYNRALEPWEVFELYRWGSLGKDMRKELVNKKGNGGDT